MYFYRNTVHLVSVLVCDKRYLYMIQMSICGLAHVIIFLQIVVCYPNNFCSHQSCLIFILRVILDSTACLPFVHPSIHINERRLLLRRVATFPNQNYPCLVICSSIDSLILTVVWQLLASSAAAALALRKSIQFPITRLAARV